jgi:hypothetical protein
MSFHLRTQVLDFNAGVDDYLRRTTYLNINHYVSNSDFV